MNAPESPTQLEFEAAYREHFAFAWRALRRLGVPERDLGDASQDVFVIVYRKYHEFDFTRPMKTWIYAICLRVASDRRRRAVLRLELLSDGREPNAEHRTGMMEDATEQANADRRALLDLALNAMSTEQRAAFTLFELEGHTGEEVAQLLDLPLATVYSRLRLARDVFRRSVERERARDRFLMSRTGGDR